MATYTIKQYTKKLQSIKFEVKPFYDVANELIGRIDNRVFNQGINGFGATIGSYSKKPVYISTSGKKNHARNLSTPPRGKYSTKPVFLNGHKRKTVYFTGGYDQFKSDVGKNTAGGRVNLWLSGSFRRAWQNSIDPVLIVESGFRIRFSLKTSALNKQKKIDGILKKYPGTFNLTKGEHQYILKRYREEFIKQFK